MDYVRIGHIRHIKYSLKIGHRQKKEHNKHVLVIVLLNKVIIKYLYPLPCASELEISHIDLPKKDW